MKNYKNNNLLIKTIDFLEFQFSWFFSKIAILQELQQENYNISGCGVWILVLRPDLEWWLDSVNMFLTQYFDFITKFWSKMSRYLREGEKSLTLSYKYID